MFEAADGRRLVFRSGSHRSAASRHRPAAFVAYIPNIHSSRGVITMADHQDRPVLAMLLEALVATALIGTFFVYGSANSGPGAATTPGDVAGLTLPR
jgi:hypothetical protein